MNYYNAMSTLGAVTPNTRAKAVAVLDHCQAVLGRTPGVLWGLGASSEHATGRAVDFMISHHGRGTDTAMGDLIADYAISQGRDWGLGWVIWRQRIYPASGTYLTNPTGGWRTMEDRGSTTENHMDHPHVYWATDNPITEQEPDMTPDQERTLNAILAAVQPGITNQQNAGTLPDQLEDLAKQFDGRAGRWNNGVMRTQSDKTLLALEALIARLDTITAAVAALEAGAGIAGPGGALAITGGSIELAARRADQ